MTVLPEEEPWEGEIGAMLGRLPTVEPPPGFIDSALDHRPLYAGRITAGLLTVSVLALVAATLTGAIGRTRVAPEIDELVSHHATVVQAGVLGPAQTEVDYRIETPVAMPEGFERTGNIEAEDLRQAIYARGDEQVSVFVQAGRVRWESLPATGLTTIGGSPAWTDENRDITVVETSDSTVTIVGLPVSEVAGVVADVPRSEPSVADRAQDLIDAITTQLGYPSVG